MKKNQHRSADRRKQTRAKTKQKANKVRLLKEHQKVEQALKNLGNWEDLEVNYRDAASLLAQATSVHQLLKNSKNYFDFIEDKAKFIACADKLSRDCTTQVSALTEIHSMHAGRTGPVYDKTNPNSALENMDVIAIVGRYLTLVEDTQNVVLPTAFELQDIIFTAMQKAADAGVMATNLANVDPAHPIPTI